MKFNLTAGVFRDPMQVEVAEDFPSNALRSAMFAYQEYTEAECIIARELNDNVVAVLRFEWADA